MGRWFRSEGAERARAQKGRWVGWLYHPLTYSYFWARADTGVRLRARARRRLAPGPRHVELGKTPRTPSASSPRHRAPVRERFERIGELCVGWGGRRGRFGLCGRIVRGVAGRLQLNG